jgi:hypothetical protein
MEVEIGREARETKLLCDREMKRKRDKEKENK